ncbi:MAG: DNA mismatch repair endonuclease MutL [Pseudomonadota bacterium]
MIEARRIRPLSTQLANQIAAGEVVERPASVLKELLENALDAGATRLEIEAEGGGVRRLSVRDDGAGIHPEDLPLAVTRHATSKIATPEELETVASLGFRGEALASIAAVARLRLVSRRAEAESGWRLAVDAGEAVPEPTPAAHPVGTTTEIRDLFFNTPARRKFLRAERTELAHLDDVVRRLALARPEVGLRFAHNGRVRLNLPPAASAFARIEGVLGARAAGATRALERTLALAAADGAELTVAGWVSPEAGEVHAFVNGRAVRDRLVQTALRRAGEELGLDGPPTAVLHLTLAPELVDVNVHPAKSEVRFRAARDVHDALVAVVGEALRGAGGTDHAGPDSAGFAHAGSASGGLEHPDSVYPGSGVSGSSGVAEMSGLPGVAGSSRHEAMPSSGAEGEVLACWPEGFALLAGSPPRILDCRAARAELYRRRLRAGLEGEGVPARRLLVPVVLTVPGAAELDESHGEALRALGLEWTPDPEGVRLQRLPDITADADPQAWVARLVAEVVERVESGTSVEADDLVEPIARRAADCPAAAPSPAAVVGLLRSLEADGGVPEGAVTPLGADAIRALVASDDQS